MCNVHHTLLMTKVGTKCRVHMTTNLSQNSMTHCHLMSLVQDTGPGPTWCLSTLQHQLFLLVITKYLQHLNHFTTDTPRINTKQRLSSSKCLDINQEDLHLLLLTCHHQLNSKHTLKGIKIRTIIIDHIKIKTHLKG